MSTQEDEPYELGEILARLIIEGQNQIHDLRDGKETPGEITERMFASLGYWEPKVEALIQQKQLEARLDGAIMGAKFGNAAFRQYNIANPGKPINLDTVRQMGIEQATEWAKRNVK